MRVYYRVRHCHDPEDYQEFDSTPFGGVNFGDRWRYGIIALSIVEHLMQLDSEFWEQELKEGICLDVYDADMELIFSKEICTVEDQKIIISK